MSASYFLNDCDSYTMKKEKKHKKSKRKEKEEEAVKMAIRQSEIDNHYR